jgi:hypothetical protein
MIAASVLWSMVRPGWGAVSRFVTGENLARRRSSERFIVGCVLIGLGVIAGMSHHFSDRRPSIGASDCLAGERIWGSHRRRTLFFDEVKPSTPPEGGKGRIRRTPSRRSSQRTHQALALFGSVARALPSCREKAIACRRDHRGNPRADQRAHHHIARVMHADMDPRVGDGAGQEPERDG